MGIVYEYPLINDLLYGLIYNYFSFSVRLIGVPESVEYLFAILYT